MRARALIVPVLVVAMELWLFRAYARLDALLHYWLHALLGAVLAVGLLTVVALVRRRAPRGAWAAGGMGHLYSATPDVLFLVAGILHVGWMDVFALHIRVHFIPLPLGTLFGLFALVLGGWTAAALGRRGVSAVSLAAAGVVVVAAFALAQPPPASLQQLREAPSLALVCSLTDAGLS